MEKKYPICIEPNNSKHQDIIFKVCKAHGIKSLELTTKHIALMSDCISEYISQQSPTGPVWVKATRWPEGRHNDVHWRRASDKKPLLIVGRNYQSNIVAQFGKVYTPEELEWLDEGEGAI